MRFLSMGLRQGSGLCSSSSCKYPETEGTNQNRQWNPHRWHAINSSERTRLSCWRLWNHKGCTYRTPVRYVTKTWSVVLLNKKTRILLSEVFYVWQIVKTPTIILNNTVFYAFNYLTDIPTVKTALHWQNDSNKKRRKVLSTLFCSEMAIISHVLIHSMSISSICLLILSRIFVSLCILCGFVFVANILNLGQTRLFLQCNRVTLECRQHN